MSEVYNDVMKTEEARQARVAQRLSTSTDAGVNPGTTSPLTANRSPISPTSPKSPVSQPIGSVVSASSSVTQSSVSSKLYTILPPIQYKVQEELAEIYFARLRHDTIHWSHLTSIVQDLQYATRDQEGEVKEGSTATEPVTREREDERNERGCDAYSCKLVLNYLIPNGPSPMIYYIIPNRNNYIIGRSGDSDIPVRDAGCSRSHARIQWDEESIRFVDLGSTYGSWLNGNPCVKASLQVGDVLKLGKKVTLTVQECDADDEKAKKKLNNKCIIS